MKTRRLEEVLALAGQNDRVCPMPQQWNGLYEMLPGRRRKGIGWEPQLPLVPAAWDDTPALLKIIRLREHIEWAANHGGLDAVGDYLELLPEGAWLHLGD